MNLATEGVNATPVQSLCSFVLENKLDETILIWPTGTGKTNAAAWVMRTLFDSKRIDHVIALVLKTTLKANLTQELSSFFDPTCFTVYHLDSFYKDIKNKSPKLMFQLNTKRIGFFVDEIDQLIPRTMILGKRCKKTDSSQRKKQRSGGRRPSGEGGSSSTIPPVEINSTSSETSGSETQLPIIDEDVFLDQKINSNQWKKKYFRLLVDIWNRHTCYLTRYILLASATPFISNLDREIEKYYQLVNREFVDKLVDSSVIMNKRTSNSPISKYRREIMNRIHYLPKRITQQFFPCVVNYQRNEREEALHPEIKIDPEYPAYLVRPSASVMLRDSEPQRGLRSIFPVIDNGKLDLLVTHLEDDPRERAFVMCFMKETQRIVHEHLTKRGIRALVASSDTKSSKKILQLLRQFEEDNSYRVLIATEFLNSGVSIPHVTQVHILEPFMMSEPTTTIQSTGRCVRLNSHNTHLARVVVRIWLYVWASRCESNRYMTAMKKQEEIRTFFDNVENHSRPFFEKYPIDNILGGKRVPRELTSIRIRDTTDPILRERCIGIHQAENLGSNNLIQLYTSQTFGAKLDKLYDLTSEMCSSRNRGAFNVVFGGIVGMSHDSFDMSHCSYGRVLCYDETTLDRIHQMREYILMHNLPETNEIWTFISGDTKKNLRRYRIDRKEAEKVKTTGKLKQSVIKGAKMSQSDIEKMFQSISSSSSSSNKSTSLDRKVEAIIKYSIPRGMYIRNLENLPKKEEDVIRMSNIADSYADSSSSSFYDE